MSCHFGRTVTLGRSLLSGFDRKVKKLTLLSGSHYFRGGGGGGKILRYLAETRLNVALFFSKVYLISDGVNFLGNILINGQLLKRKPLFSITMALWLKLDTNRGEQAIFSTCNPDNPWNSHVQYSFKIIDGRVKWFHRNEKSQVRYHKEH